MIDDPRDKTPEPHPGMPDWAKPMFDLLAMVHQGNVEAKRDAQTVRHRVWQVEVEQLAINEKIRELQREVRMLRRRDTLPSPSPDDEPTSPSYRVADHDGDPGP